MMLCTPTSVCLTLPTSFSKSEVPTVTTTAAMSRSAGAIHEYLHVAPKLSRKRAAPQRMDEMNSKVAAFLSTGAWNDLPPPSSDKEYKAAASFLGLAGPAESTRPPSAESTWASLENLCASACAAAPIDLSVSSATKRRRRSSPSEADVNSAVSDFLSVGAWNELPPPKSVSEFDVRRAANILCLPMCQASHEPRLLVSSEGVEWATAEAMIKEPLRAASPTRPGKISQITSVVPRSNQMCLHDNDFGASSDCISGLVGTVAAAIS
mmetsp:Transcript_31606/g.71050  ORF Transcript_31606/g.71050 Transcript_31606/m.71050 type:complete len:266 (+) Transcript_31606:88-885(+)